MSSSSGGNTRRKASRSSDSTIRKWIKAEQSRTKNDEGRVISADAKQTVSNDSSSLTCRLSGLLWLPWPLSAAMTPDECVCMCVCVCVCVRVCVCLCVCVCVCV